MKLYSIILLILSISGCQKETSIAPTDKKPEPVKNITTSTMSPQPITNDPEYLYNGSTGSGEVVVNCKDCSGLIKTKTYYPFIWDTNGNGKLKYEAMPGDTLLINICPKGEQVVSIIIYNKDKTQLLNRTEIIASPKSYTYIF